MLNGIHGRCISDLLIYYYYFFIEILPLDIFAQFFQWKS